jgi:hypothetical protein
MPSLLAPGCPLLRVLGLTGREGVGQAALVEVAGATASYVEISGMSGASAPDIPEHG